MAICSWPASRSVASSHKRFHLVELALFRVERSSWGRDCGGRLLSFVLLAESPAIQTEKDKTTDKDATEHVLLLNEQEFAIKLDRLLRGLDATRGQRSLGRL